MEVGEVLTGDGMSVDTPTYLSYFCRVQSDFYLVYLNENKVYHEFSSISSNDYFCIVGYLLSVNLKSVDVVDHNVFSVETL